MQFSAGLEAWRAPSASCSHPVDRAHLARYTMGDADLEREILELFASQTWKTIAELRQAPSDETWHVAAHTLKGSARAVGAWELAAEAERAERLTGARDRDAVLDAIERIERAATTATRYVRQLADAA